MANDRPKNAASRPQNSGQKSGAHGELVIRDIPLPEDFKRRSPVEVLINPLPFPKLTT